MTGPTNSSLVLSRQDSEQRSAHGKLNTPSSRVILHKDNDDPVGEHLVLFCMLYSYIVMTTDKIKVTTCGSYCLERGRANIPLSKELRLYG